jgi:hypothetical protein
MTKAPKRLRQTGGGWLDRWRGSRRRGWRQRQNNRRTIFANFHVLERPMLRRKFPKRPTSVRIIATKHTPPSQVDDADAGYWRFFTTDFVFNHHFTGSGSAATA